MKRIETFSHLFNGKRPEHGVNHLWPIPHPAKKKSAHKKGDLLIAILNDPILVMSTNATKGNSLTRVIYVLVKSFITKVSIVRLVLLDSVISLLKDLLINFLCKKSFLKSEILHEMNIDKIACVVTKIGRAPDTITGGKASHLRYQTWLSRNNLIHRDAITWFSIVGMANTAIYFAFGTSRAPMCLTKLTSNTEQWLILASENGTR